MAKGKFVYRGAKRTVEVITQKSKQSSGVYDSYIDSNLPMFKPKEGENCVRIMPATWEPDSEWGAGWEITVYLHYQVGADNGTYLCTDSMKKGDCPICAARAEEADDEQRNQMRPQGRQICWIIDRDNEKAGPQVWGLPTSLFRDINARSVDKKTKNPILIDDPDEGFDIIFSREGTGLKTKYTGVDVMRDPSNLHDDEDKQDIWLDYISDHGLPDALTFYPPEHIEKVLHGKASSKRSEEDGGADARPARSRRSREEPSAEEEPDARPVRRERSTEEVPPERRRRTEEASSESESRVESRRRPREEAPAEEPKRRGRPPNKVQEEADAYVEEEKDEAPFDEDDSTSTAKRSLERLRTRRGR